MHPVIYSVTLKDSSFNSENKTKYVVIKEHDSYFSRAFSKDNKPIVNVIDNHKFKFSDTYLIIFKVEKVLSENLKEYLNTMLRRFSEQNDNLKQESNNFIKFLEADGKYNVRQLDENDNLNEEINSEKLSTEINAKIISSQEFLDAERENPRASAPSLSIDNQSLSNSSIDTHFENENLGSTSSLPNPNKESNSTERPSFVSLQDLIANQSLTESREESVKLVQKIQSVFSDQNKTLLDIKEHGSAIERGYFNGLEKSIYLKSISTTAKRIDSDIQDFLSNPTSEINVESLKEEINKLQKFVHNIVNSDALSRYRGVSLFKCFATLWGGGKVKSIGYVNQLQDQLTTLTEEISMIRPVN